MSRNGDGRFCRTGICQIRERPIPPTGRFVSGVIQLDEFHLCNTGSLWQNGRATTGGNLHSSAHQKNGQKRIDRPQHMLLQVSPEQYQVAPTSALTRTTLSAIIMRTTSGYSLVNDGRSSWEQDGERVRFNRISYERPPQIAQSGRVSRWCRFTYMPDALGSEDMR